MPRTATLRQLTEDELSQLHIALDARIEVLERVAGEDPDAEVSGDLMAMLRQLAQDITEARRAVSRGSAIGDPQAPRTLACRRAPGRNKQPPPRRGPSP